MGALCTREFRSWVREKYVRTMIIAGVSSSGTSATSLVGQIQLLILILIVIVLVARLSRLEQGSCGCKRIGEGRLQGGDKRVYEDRQFVVLLIQGKPGMRAINLLHPLGQQRRLAKAGRGAHQGDLAAECRMQAFDETSPGEDVAATGWSVEFCAHERAHEACRDSWL